MFTDALDAEGLLAGVEARADGIVPVDVDDDARPILLAVSDNGPQMTSGSTREFLALCAIAQHRDHRHDDPDNGPGAGLHGRLGADGQRHHYVRAEVLLTL